MIIILYGGNSVLFCVLYYIFRNPRIVHGFIFYIICLFLLRELRRVWRLAARPVMALSSVVRLDSTSCFQSGNVFLIDNYL